MVKHFTRTEDFTKDEYLEIIRRTKIIEEGIAAGKDFTHVCPGKIIATEFFQESTRTSASLQAAMMKLGGGWFGIAGIKGTYLETGEEDLEDTLRGVAPIADIMAVRHKDFDLTAFAASGFPIPLINAMSGSEEHSLSGTAILYTLYRQFGKIDGLKIGIYGMTKSSRPTKTFLKVLSRFGATIYEDSVIPEFKTPQAIRDTIVANGSTYQEDKLENFIDKVDFLNVVEGLPQAGEDPALVDKFNAKFKPFTKVDMAKVRPDTFIEIGEPRATTDGRLVALKETDDDPRVREKKMMKYLVFTNMALISYLLGAPIE